MDVQLVIALVAFGIAIAGFIVAFVTYREAKRDYEETVRRNRSVK